MTAHTHTVIVTAGRNVGSEPLSPALWDSFRDDIYNTLCAHRAEIVQRPLTCAVFSQSGLWNGIIIEDACTFVAFMRESHLFALRHDLGEIRKRYQQEAIGFIAAEGISHLV